MNAVDEVKGYLRQFQVNPEPVHQRLLTIGRDPNSFSIAIGLLQTSTSQVDIWFSQFILKNIVSFSWVPRSMNPSPEKSSVPANVKQQTREFLSQYLLTRIQQLDVISSNFIYQIIITMMKVDYANDGNFWLSFCREQLNNPEKRPIALHLLKNYSDSLQAVSDHMVPSRVFQLLKNAFTSMMPDITAQVMNVLSTTTTPDNSTISCLQLISSFMHTVINPKESELNLPAVMALTDPSLVSIILRYSCFSMGPISIEAHKCIYALFLRADVVYLKNLDSRAQFLNSVLMFFQNEIREFVQRFHASNLTEEAIQINKNFAISLIESFVPFTKYYFFKLDQYDENGIHSLLTQYEEYCWAMLGTPVFQAMIEIWNDFLLSTSASSINAKYMQYYLAHVEHILDALNNDEMRTKFSEDDIIIMSDFIDAANHVKAYRDEVTRIVNRTTALAVNNNLPSTDILLRIFYNVVHMIQDNDKNNEPISNTMLQYLNRLMTKREPNDTPETFEIVTTIIKTNVRKFSHHSDFFLQKVFHLVTISIPCGPSCIMPVIQLFLDTLQVQMPETPVKIVLPKMLEMREAFAQMPPPIYSAYLACCLRMKSVIPTDGGSRPIASSPDEIVELYAQHFENLRNPALAPISLMTMKESLNIISCSAKETKNLVYAAFAPTIPIIFEIYETGLNEQVFVPLLDYFAAFIATFLTELAGQIPVIIHRLFAPIEGLLATLTEGSPECHATYQFLQILLMIVKLHTAAAEQQTEMIATFVLNYHSVFMETPIEITRLFLKLACALISDKVRLMPDEIAMNILQIFFFEGLNVDDPEAITISANAIHHGLSYLIEKIDLSFKIGAFNSVVMRLCKCTHTAMRETTVDLAYFICTTTPDFPNTLIIPFIRSLSVTPEDQDGLILLFSQFTSEAEFKKAFIDFCDDVSYLLLGVEDAFSS